MEFANPKSLVDDARKRGYGVPAFNTNGGSYDIARAALEAAEHMRSPLILQVYEPNCAYRGYRYFVNLANFLCDELAISVPVALQLDHGHSIESVTEVMDAGFTGVMFDASHEPLETNIAETRKVLKAAHARGVSVEAEVGCVKGNEPPKSPQIGRVPVPLEPSIPPTKTPLEEAVQFTEAVPVDMLAVSVGTTHGVWQRQSGIDFDLLKAIRDAVQVPLVQHGTGGISCEDLSSLVKCGMSKINFGEPFRYDYIRHFNERTDSMEHLWHPWRIMEQVKERIKAHMKQLIEALGAVGKA